jgi:hypothetical protein
MDLSQGIKALERKLGVQLFDRRRQEVTLTAAGEPLLPPVRQLLAQADEVGRRAEHIASTLHGVLRVSQRRGGPGRTRPVAHDRAVGVHAGRGVRRGPLTPVSRVEPDEPHMLAAVAERAGIGLLTEAAGHELPLASGLRSRWSRSWPL